MVLHTDRAGVKDRGRRGEEAELYTIAHASCRSGPGKERLRASPKQGANEAISRQYTHVYSSVQPLQLCATAIKAGRSALATACSTGDRDGTHLECLGEGDELRGARAAGGRCGDRVRVRVRQCCCAYLCEYAAVSM